jgi:protein-S-isoprenylcysteine O-methyltransferase Ste14
MSDTFFRVALALVSALLGAIRLYYGWQARRSGGKVIAKFGKAYRVYMRRTGRFLPRLRR